MEKNEEKYKYEEPCYRMKRVINDLWLKLRYYTISFKMIKTFFRRWNLMVTLCIFLTCLATIIAYSFNAYFNFQASILVSPIVLPLSFLIRGDFRRRENALQLLAQFKAMVLGIFLTCRGIKEILEVSDDVVEVFLNKLIQIVVHTREYLQTKSTTKRIYLQQIVYEDFSDLTQLTEFYHNKNIPGIAVMMARIYRFENYLLIYFEKLRVIRDYRSPRSARSFSKIMMFFAPIFFAPLHVYMAKDFKKGSLGMAIIFGVIHAVVFGYLQSVQDRLDDPFLGVAEDEINLDDFFIWIGESLNNVQINKNKKSKIFINIPESNSNLNFEENNDISWNSNNKDIKENAKVSIGRKVNLPDLINKDVK